MVVGETHHFRSCPHIKFEFLAILMVAPKGIRRAERVPWSTSQRHASIGGATPGPQGPMELAMHHCLDEGNLDIWIWEDIEIGTPGVSYLRKTLNLNHCNSWMFQESSGDEAISSNANCGKQFVYSDGLQFFDNPGRHTMTIPIASMGLVYLPTFTIKVNQM